jgi:hypothetical protein
MKRKRRRPQCRRRQYFIQIIHTLGLLLPFFALRKGASPRQESETRQAFYRLAPPELMVHVTREFNKNKLSSPEFGISENARASSAVCKKQQAACSRSSRVCTLVWKYMAPEIPTRGLFFCNFVMWECGKYYSGTHPRERAHNFIPFLLYSQKDTPLSVPRGFFYEVLKWWPREQCAIRHHKVFPFVFTACVPFLKLVILRAVVN